MHQNSGIPGLQEQGSSLYKLQIIKCSGTCTFGYHKVFIIMHKIEIETLCKTNREDWDFTTHKISRLFHDSYVRDGFIYPQERSELRHFDRFNNLKNTTIWVARSNSHLIGSISMTIDIGETLPVNPVFDEAIVIQRKELDQPVIVTWRLVTSSEAPVLLAKKLIKCVIHKIIYDYGYSTCFIAYYLKHERAYKRILNGEIIARGSLIGNSVIKPEPSGLMRVDAKKLGKTWFE